MSEKRSHAEILKELMESKNMRAVDLARAAGLPPTTIYSMLKRNNRNTEPETLAKISKALNIPISFWNDFNDESRLLRIHNLAPMEQQTISSTSFYNTLSFKGLSVEYICHVLQAFGYPEYTPELLKEVIDNQVAISYTIASIIQDALFNEPLIKYKDYKFIEDYNSLSKQSKELVEEIIKVLHKSEKYEDVQINNMIKKFHNQNDS